MMLVDEVETTTVELGSGVSECVPSSWLAGLKSFKFGDEDFAVFMDIKDELRSMRDQFIFPKITGSMDSCVYLCGNSLGLQPKLTQKYVQEELDKWGELGVEGHFMTERPWVTIDELCVKEMSKIVGAMESEVATMNSLTVNLHLLMISFYRPTSTRNKILIETKAFPSDYIAVRSQIIEKGYDPDECLIEVKPGEGKEVIDFEEIEAIVTKHADSLALVMLSGVQYYTGQSFQVQKITEMVKRVTDNQCNVGYDLAHAVGNVELRLHDWNVDFACWCSYKYLNSGPGGMGGCFVHSKHGDNPDIPRLAGWWGHRKEDRFKMNPCFIPSQGAFGWQLSNPAVLTLAALRASLKLFSRAEMPRLLRKQVSLTRYLELLLQTLLPKGSYRVITPAFDRRRERGAQLSLVFAKPVKTVHDYLQKNGIICDIREPDVMRIAPAPMYNSYQDIFRFVNTLKQAL